jgi:hypothetical protein
MKVEEYLNLNYKSILKGIRGIGILIKKSDIEYCKSLDRDEKLNQLLN